MTSLATEIDGTGDAVVFVHGLGGTSNVFAPQVRVLSRFFRCVRPDLPGAGRSPADGPISIETLSSRVLEVIEECATPVHVVAHSMGTVLAQRAAVLAPAKIRSLALLGPIHAPAAGARDALKARAVTARTKGMKVIADTIVQGALSAATWGDLPAVVALVRELLMRQDAEGYASHCEALAAAEGAELTKIGQPVLLLTGDEDATAAAGAVAQMARKLSHSSLRILGRCGHWASLERPAEVSEALLEFLLRG
jgi:3-oxoadipate enol-lactonase